MQTIIIHTQPSINEQKFTHVINGSNGSEIYIFTDDFDNGNII